MYLCYVASRLLVLGLALMLRFLYLRKCGRVDKHEQKQRDHPEPSDRVTLHRVVNRTSERDWLIGTAFRVIQVTEQATSNRHHGWHDHERE